MAPLVLSLFLALTAHAGEKELLKKYPKLFSRKGEVLTIVTGKGNREYKNNRSDSDAALTARLMEYKKDLNLALVNLNYYESGDIALVSLATNEVVLVNAAPKWKQGAFASATSSDGYGDPGQLQIGFCDENSCKVAEDRQGFFGPAKFPDANTVEAETLGEPDKEFKAGKRLGKIVCKLDRAQKTVACAAK